ncbi:MlaD family protein [Nocardia lijiangensis]|uniref:MlaD family protein n=1 Tax=Nocardia lijiangensis TaxID=299618 RepID=UPI000833B3CF|nr:MlaD family protein [Nocardia lijiangensis]
MPGVISRWFGDDRPVLDDAAKRRREIRFGIIGVALVALGMLAAAVLYVVPFGKTTYIAELSEAQSVKTGDDVRLAGVSVGSVESLELRPDRVVMKFTVKSDVFLGDQTSLDIRMLTVVGGHYVALFPAGSAPLGDKPIPADRVRLPYSLIQTFQDATTPLNELDGDTLRRNLSALDESLTSAPETLRTTLDTVGGYIDAIDRQRAQVSHAIAVADEYVTMYDGAKTDLGRLMDNVNLLETVLIDKRAELRESVALIDSVVQRLAALAPVWESTLKPRAQQLADALPRLEEMGGKLEPMIASTQQLSERLRSLVIPEEGVVLDRSGQTVPAPSGLDLSSVCVPVPGKEC